MSSVNNNKPQESSSGGPPKPRPGRQSTLDTFFRPPLPKAPPNSLGTEGSGHTKMSPAVPKPMANRPRTPAGTRIAVVLARSPGLHPAHYSHHDELDDDAPPANLISELSPQFRRLAAQAAKSVSLSNHSIAYGDSADEPDELAQPRAKLQSRKQLAQSPKKKRGRPKGYRPSLMLSDAKKAKRSAQTAPTPKKATTEGARTSPPTPREIYDSLKPAFVRFICEWEGCKAELHNLETLERHTTVVHVKQRAGDGTPVYCRWRKCAISQDGLPAKTFASPEGLQQHIDETHMSAQRWYVGDGPKIPALSELREEKQGGGDELPAYLFDKDGNQVTPSIQEQKEEDHQTYRERKRKLKMLQLEWDKNAPEEGEGYDENAVEADEDRLYG